MSNYHWNVSDHKAWAKSKLAETLTLFQRDLAILGFCPFCEMQIRNWKIGNIDTQSELFKQGIDAWTGHLYNCEYDNIKL